jgi:predicted MPP superfamily phosphohydrolase
MFGLGARLAGIHSRGRRNALNVRLVNVSLSFPDLPPAFDGYRILQLSDTHLDFLPDLSAVAAALLAGVEVDLLALTGDGARRLPCTDRCIHQTACRFTQRSPRE